MSIASDDLWDLVVAIADAINSSWGIEIVMLLIGLIATYGIVETVLRLREKRTWEPARRRLLSMVRRQCEGALIAWARNSNPEKLTLEDGGLKITEEKLHQLAEELENEVRELEELPQASVFEARDAEHWRAQIHGLSTINESLRLAIDRAQLTLREEPEMVEALTNLEIAYLPVPGMNDHLNDLRRLRQGATGTYAKTLDESADKQLRLGASMLVMTWRRFLQVWNLVQDVPGMLPE